MWRCCSLTAVRRSPTLTCCATSPWAGSQRHGALVWSGDIASTWESLRAQITAGIHIGVAGIPWFTTDIGGFLRRPRRRPRVPRAARALVPVRHVPAGHAPTRGPGAGCRGDGRRRDGAAAVGAPNEVWSYGDEVYGILRSHLLLREALREYTRAAMAEAHADGQPVMRGVFHGFPEDPVAWTLTDQFLFGADLLVEPGARSRRLYLQAGASWVSLATGERFDGGAWVEVAAPLEVRPVFARDDSCAQLVGRRVGLTASGAARRSARPHTPMPPNRLLTPEVSRILRAVSQDGHREYHYSEPCHDPTQGVDTRRVDRRANPKEEGADSDGQPLCREEHNPCANEEQHEEFHKLSLTVEIHMPRSSCET